MRRGFRLGSVRGVDVVADLSLLLIAGLLVGCSQDDPLEPQGSTPTYQRDKDGTETLGFIDIPDGSVDLLISLFTGPMWEACRRYLRPGGLMLANTSHGDASLAALDPALRLTAVAHHRDDRYRFVTDGLEEYLVPKRAEAADADRIRTSGRGIAYTRTAFAYLFHHCGPVGTTVGRDRS